MLTGLPPARARPFARAAGVTRRTRLLATLLDALALLPPLVAATALAVTWLLTRTAWGRDDARALDGGVAVALLAAAFGAWLARLGYALVTAHATPGQRARGLRVEVMRTSAEPPPAFSRALRLALHPFGAAGWALVAGALFLAGAREVAAIVGGFAALVVAGGVVSLTIVLAAPGARGVHDRIAGTRVVRA